MNWSPLQDTFSATWEPRGGWNPAFSEQEKIKAIHLFFFFTGQKHYPAPQAEVLVQMVLWKRKYPTLRYATTQERALQEALRPVIH
jgi:hypothetical protein